MWNTEQNQCLILCFGGLDKRWGTTNTLSSAKEVGVIRTIDFKHSLKWFKEVSF